MRKRKNRRTAERKIGVGRIMGKKKKAKRRRGKERDDQEEEKEEEVT